MNGFQVIYWHDHTHTASYWVEAESPADAIAKTEAAFPGKVFDAEAKELK